MTYIAAVRLQQRNLQVVFAKGDRCLSEVGIEPKTL